MKSLPFLFLALLTSCKSGPDKQERITDVEKAFSKEIKEETTSTESEDLAEKTMPSTKETITFGTGCYWCSEAIFQQLDGVESVTSGFMGGHIPNPTYEQVCTKTTGHVEVIHIVFDPSVISTKTLLMWFWKSHDPTDAGGQGADRGPQYATSIFYHSDEQKALAEKSMGTAQAVFDKPIATKIRKAETFYKAKDEHQDFYFNNKNNRYCNAVINPKLEKLGLDQ